MPSHILPGNVIPQDQRLWQPGPLPQLRAGRAPATFFQGCPELAVVTLCLCCSLGYYRCRPAGRGGERRHRLLQGSPQLYLTRRVTPRTTVGEEKVPPGWSGAMGPPLSIHGCSWQHAAVGRLLPLGAPSSPTAPPTPPLEMPPAVPQVGSAGLLAPAPLLGLRAGCFPLSLSSEVCGVAVAELVSPGAGCVYAWRASLTGLRPSVCVVVAEPVTGRFPALPHSR